jgi:hypothetical protein
MTMMRRRHRQTKGRAKQRGNESIAEAAGLLRHHRPWTVVRRRGPKLCRRECALREKEGRAWLRHDIRPGGVYQQSAPGFGVLLLLRPLGLVCCVAESGAAAAAKDASRSGSADAHPVACRPCPLGLLLAPSSVPRSLYSLAAFASYLASVSAPGLRTATAFTDTPTARSCCALPIAPFSSLSSSPSASPLPPFGRCCSALLCLLCSAFSLPLP